MYWGINLCMRGTPAPALFIGLHFQAQSQDALCTLLLRLESLPQTRAVTSPVLLMAPLPRRVLCFREIVLIFKKCLVTATLVCRETSPERRQEAFVNESLLVRCCL